MARVTIETNDTKFFVYDKAYFRVIIWGVLFGLMLAIMPLLVNYIFCWLLPAQCLGDTVQAFRVGIVLSAAVTLIIMVLTRSERPIYVLAPALIVFWNLILFMPLWPGRLLIYGLLGGLVFAMFGWLARINNWLISAIATVLVTLILFLIAR